MKEIIENAKSVIANYQNYKGIVASEAGTLENKIMTIRAAVSKMVADL